MGLSKAIAIAYRGVHTSHFVFGFQDGLSIAGCTRIGYVVEEIFQKPHVSHLFRECGCVSYTNALQNTGRPFWLLELGAQCDENVEKLFTRTGFSCDGIENRDHDGGDTKFESMNSLHEVDSETRRYVVYGGMGRREGKMRKAGVQL